MASPPMKARFQCPLCGSARYAAVRLRRRQGASRGTDFFRCTGCFFPFADPAGFIQLFEPATLAVATAETRQSDTWH